MKQDLSPVTVLATFSDRVSAEIACALLSEASIHSGEPEPAEDGTWLAERARRAPGDRRQGRSYPEECPSKRDNDRERRATDCLRPL